MDNRDRGDIGEIKFIEYCVKKGYNVLTPFSGANKTRYDFVVDNGIDLKRVQVKYISLYKNNTLTVSFVKPQNGRPGKKLHYNENEFEKFIVYCPDTDKLYDIPTEYMKQKFVGFRMDKPKNNQTKGVKFLYDYELKGL
jgi:hypothetical protein